MGISRVIAIKKCTYCSKDVEIKHKSRLDNPHIFCSKICESNFRKSKSELNTICIFCSKKFHMKPFQKNKYKTHYCSKDCQNKAREEYMKGDGNHQYGLKGELNSSWKSDERISYYGYKLIRKLEHPFKNCDDFVFEHRLIAEQYLLTNENSVTIRGVKYLKRNLIVHHKDFNKLNNDVNNLMILPRDIHTSFHKNYPYQKYKNNPPSKEVINEFIKNYKNGGSTTK